MTSRDTLVCHGFLCGRTAAKNHLSLSVAIPSTRQDAAIRVQLALCESFDLSASAFAQGPPGARPPLTEGTLAETATRTVSNPYLYLHQMMGPACC